MVSLTSPDLVRLIANESTWRLRFVNPASRQSRASHLPKPLSLSVGARNICSTGPVVSFGVPPSGGSAVPDRLKAELPTESISRPSYFNETSVPENRLNATDEF